MGLRDGNISLNGDLGMSQAEGNLTQFISGEVQKSTGFKLSKEVPKVTASILTCPALNRKAHRKFLLR